MATSRCITAVRGAAGRRLSLCALLLVTALLLLHPVHAVVYTTAITSANVPSVYGASGASPVEGLYQTCLRSTNASATSTDRMALTIRTSGMASMVAEVVGTGRYYIAGYYNPTADGWYWNDGLSGTVTLFGQGPTSTAVNNILALRWAAGYPRMESGTATVGSLRYMVYDGTLKGWVNVAGTALYDGVACESQDEVVEVKKKFPWWAILIIVLGSVVVIALVVVLVVCCCCCSRKKGDENSNEGSDDESEMEGNSFGNSRNRSFNSRYAASRSRGSFSSNGSSYSATSKGSSLTSTKESDSHSRSVSPTNSHSTDVTSSSDSYSSYSASSSSGSSDNRSSSGSRAH